MEPPDATHRRPLLKAMAGGALALGAATAGARIALHPGDSSSPGGAAPALQLSSDGGSNVPALDINLGDSLLPQASPGRWASRQLPASTHSMVGFTWAESAKPPRIHIRSRVGGTWQPWRPVPHLHDLPDLDAEERTDQTGTELIWIGDADGIQINVAEQRPRDLTLVLLHPQPMLVPDTLGRKALEPDALQRASTAPSYPRPTILTRQDWQADEAWRNGAPRYNATIQQVHIHHTVSSNTYTEADVPALIRGMYRYHTHNLGWSDLAYNFLVDRFGRIWTGRAGGADKPVRGAHTLGFNATSTGVSVIGNYETAVPSAATIDAVATVAAWKLDRYGRDPLGQVAVVSEGSDKYAANKPVTLPVVDGHRDTNDTACPGQKLYDVLPTIRQKARDLIDQHHATSQAVTVTRAASVAGTPRLGATLTADPGTFTPPDATVTFAWLRSGVAIPGAVGATYRTVAADVGTQLSVRVDTAKAPLQPAMQTVNANGLVIAPTTVTVQPRTKSRKVIVHVRVTGPTGVTVPVTGEVVVRLNDRRKTLQLVNGRAVARFGRGAPLKPGTYAVKAAYRGSSAFASRRAAATITVP